MKKNLKRPLNLNVETLRSLTASDLRNAVGGGSGLVRTYNSCGPCSTYEDTNCYPGGNSAANHCVGSGGYTQLC